MLSEMIPHVYVPHNKNDEFHNDLIEYVEEVDHHLAFLTHLAEKNAKPSTEANQTCEQRTHLSYLFIETQTCSNHYFVISCYVNGFVFTKELLFLLC